MPHVSIYLPLIKYIVNLTSITIITKKVLPIDRNICCLTGKIYTNVRKLSEMFILININISYII